MSRIRRLSALGDRVAEGSDVNGGALRRCVAAPGEHEHGGYHREHG
jgi:hypothetical protein